MRFIALVFSLFFTGIVLAGDDASVHVHIESAAGPDTAMRLPLFNYYRSAMGASPNPDLAAAFSQWYGDEVHSQGPDMASQQLTVGNSAEQQPRRVSAPDQQQDYPQPGSRGPHYRRKPSLPASDDELYRPSHRAYKSQAGESDYEVPLPQRRSDKQPRHVHGTTEAVPPWVLRKKILKKYGIRKYLQPYANLKFPVTRSISERVYQSGSGIEAVHSSSGRRAADYSRYPDPYYPDYDGLDY